MKRLDDIGKQIEQENRINTLNERIITASGNVGTYYSDKQERTAKDFEQKLMARSYYQNTGIIFDRSRLIRNWMYI